MILLSHFKSGKEFSFFLFSFLSFLPIFLIYIFSYLEMPTWHLSYIMLLRGLNHKNGIHSFIRDGLLNVITSNLYKNKILK